MVLGRARGVDHGVHHQKGTGNCLGMGILHTAIVRCGTRGEFHHQTMRSPASFTWCLEQKLSYLLSLSWWLQPEAHRFIASDTIDGFTFDRGLMTIAGPNPH